MRALLASAVQGESLFAVAGIPRRCGFQLPPSQINIMSKSQSGIRWADEIRRGKIIAEFIRLVDEWIEEEEEEKRQLEEQAALTAIVDEWQERKESK